MTVNPGTGQRVYVTGGAAFTNTGALSITSGAFALDDDYRQTAGSTTPGTGARVQVLGSSSVVRLYGGSPVGTGGVYGPLNNYGAAVSPSGYGTLAIHGVYYQATGGRAYFDDRGATHDHITVYGLATVRGTMTVRNRATSKSTARLSLLSASGKVTASLHCVATTGAGSTGTHARHWSAYVSGHTLVVRSVAGARTHC